MLIIMFLAAVSVSVGKDDKEQTMAEFDSIVAEIKELPAAIDDDLCSGDKASYRKHMTELAQKIIDANKVIKDMKISYPIDLWSIYNKISRNPVCGSGIKAEEIFELADKTRIADEEKMGIRESDDLCPCWNIATGRNELTGYWKDGACRCIYGAGK